MTDDNFAIILGSLNNCYSLARVAAARAALAALKQELAEAKAENSRLRGQASEAAHAAASAIHDLGARAEAAESNAALSTRCSSNAARLREALANWGRHESDCTALNGGEGCSCGLTEVSHRGGGQLMSDEPNPTWAERLARAVESFEHWDQLPIYARMDRVFKESGVRDLIVRAEAAEARAKELEAKLSEVSAAYEASVIDYTRLEAAEADNARLRDALTLIAATGCRIEEDETHAFPESCGACVARAAADCRPQSGFESVTASGDATGQGQTGKSGEPRASGYVTRSNPEDSAAIVLLQRVVQADRDDAKMGHPNPGESCVSICIGLEVMPFLDGSARLLPGDTAEESLAASGDLAGSAGAGNTGTVGTSTPDDGGREP